MRTALAGIVVIALAAWLHAQYQTRQPSGVGQVNPQINSELYGHGLTNTIRYAPISSVPMPSEVQQAYWRSGATPSEVAMNAASIGPVTPGGAMSYIPSGSSYLAKPTTPLPAALGASAYTPAATIRYSAPASSSYVSPAVGASSMVSSGPINAGPINTSIRYGR